MSIDYYICSSKLKRILIFFINQVKKQWIDTTLQPMLNSNSKPCFWRLTRRCDISRNRWSVQYKKPNTSARSVPDSVRSSNATAILPSKKDKCTHCGKAINWDKNLEKYLRSCEKAPKHSAKQQFLQRTLVGTASSKNGLSMSMKLIVEEEQVGGSPTKHAEHCRAPEIVESALKYMALTFRNTFNSNNKRDVLQLFKELIHSIRPVIYGETGAIAEAVKWYLSLSMNFCKSTNPAIKTDLTVTFCSEVFKSIDINCQFHVGYNQIVLQISEFQCNGSGWVVDHLHHLDLGNCFL